MVAFKILTAVIGAAAVFAGIYIAFAADEKKETLGLLSAIAGFLVFCVSMLLVFVPGFFS